jgi:hypothetical protein
MTYRAEGGKCIRQERDEVKRYEKEMKKESQKQFFNKGRRVSINNKERFNKL